MSCIWWKSYQRSKSLDSNERTYGLKLYKLFEVLRAKEIVEINIEPIFVGIVPISSKPYPQIFNIDDWRLKCVNYPESVCKLNECSGAPAHISQVINIDSSGDTDDNCSQTMNGDHSWLQSDGDDDHMFGKDTV